MQLRRALPLFLWVGGVVMLCTLLHAPALSAAGPATPSAPALPPAWAVECVDCPRYFENMTDRSFRLDSADKPHLAYGGDALYHMYALDTGWQRETVDPAPGVGSYASMAISGDTIAIAYYDARNADLKVAIRQSGVWQIATVDATGSVGTHASAAFDALGRLHVSYFDDTNDDLRYALWDGASWSTQTVDSASAAGMFSSLAIDSANHPHISYIQYVNGSGTPYVVRYAAFDGTSWQLRSAKSEAVSLLYTSLALDSADLPVIAFQNAQNGVLHVVRRDSGGTWNDVAVTPPGDVNNGAWPSLAIDGSGQLHVAYQGTSQARHAYTDPSLGWQFEQVDVTVNSGAFSSLAVDSQGAVHITYGYNSFYYGDLRYARKTQGAWQPLTIDHREDPGSRSSLAIDGTGIAHIAYKVDYTGRSLRYAVQSAGGWLTPTIDLRMTGFAGDYPSLRTTASGEPRASYYGGLYGGLRLIELTGGAWVSATVAGDLQSSLTGAHTSLALATDGSPHIAYAGVTQPGYISYAKRSPAVWQTQNVETFNGCGYTALALTATDQPQIAYCWGNTVRLATWNGASWVKTGIVTSTLPPSHIDLALDSGDVPHIAYQDPVARNLRYVTRQGSTWISETVDAALDTGYYNAITVDMTGTVSISYFDKAAQNLNVAQRTGSGWITQTVAAVGPIFAKTTIAVAPSGALGIAFYDAWRHDLKIAASGVFTTGPGNGGGGDPSPGGGVVTDCSSAVDLLAKVGGGGTVTFACDGTIVVPEITITRTTVISATGYDVTLSGDDANRHFAVQPDAGLALHSLKLTGGNAATAGGAVRIEPGAWLTITQSTLAGNVAPAGGAVFNDGGRLFVENSTFSGNQATATSGTQGGGAIHQAQTGATAPAATIRFSTFHSNTVAAGSSTGGGIFPAAGMMTVTATILDDPIPCSLDGNPGAILSVGYNLERADTCGLTDVTDLTATDPLLGPLGFGQDPVTGPHVLVHIPAYNSPAVDSIPVAQCAVPVDQENRARPQEGNGTPPADCDRGAVEPLDGDTLQTAPLVVNDEGDSDDGRCTINHCSLREAIIQANGTVTSSAQTIRFNFGDTLSHAIVLAGPLPAITVPVVVDGLSAPGARCTTWPPTLRVVLGGSGAGSAADGLHLAGDSSTVRGLVIGGFDGAGVHIDGNDNRVECTYLGADAAGAAALPNGTGLTVRGSSNRIGGTSAATRNLIAGNTLDGIAIEPGASGQDSLYNRVQGNFIGVQADGATPLANGRDGVRFGAVPAPAAAAGANNVASNLLGGDDTAAGNLIAHNDRNGVTVFCCADNRITANAIYSNTQFGIDLVPADGSLGVTANDTGDGDSGGNSLQNFPVLASAAGASSITVTLNSAASTLYRLEFFAGDGCDASGYGEGARLVGTITLMTNSGGNVQFSQNVAAVPDGTALTATATRLSATPVGGQTYGSTSEFSACIAKGEAVTPPPPVAAALFLPAVLRQ